jgi:hypothetical protein
MKPAVGRVYVLSNKAMPGLLKIGYTMNTVEGRVKELSSATGVPSEFFIEYQVECRDAATVEALVHDSLQSTRHDNSREFFSISLADAISEIRRHAKEIIDEEIAGCIDSSKPAVTFYLIRVNSSKNIFRVGLVKGNKEFLATDEFKSLVNDLYNHFDSRFFYDCEVIHSNEFTYVDEVSLDRMKEILDGNIKRLKTLNIDLFDTNGFLRSREYDRRLNGKYDLRTLAFKEYKEGLPVQIYNSSLSLLVPIAKACLDKTTAALKNFGVSEDPNQEKSKRLDVIKKMGI